jgi:uncharacterized damage-inducible protein DinB
VTTPSTGLADIFELLDTERRALHDAVARVPEADRDRRPAEQTWSVAEVLEHLAVVERGVARLIALRGRQPPQNEAAPVPLDDERVARLRNRAERIEVPDRVRPTGTVSAEEALTALADSRAKLCEAVSLADAVSLDGCTFAHAVLGVLTLRDWARFVAHHEARHAEQISAIARALT